MVIIYALILVQYTLQVKAANRQLKGIIDGTRTLVRDLNSIQFYN